MPRPFSNCRNKSPVRSIALLGNSSEENREDRTDITPLLVKQLVGQKRWEV